ncbi:MAG: acyl-CoA dehydrogenase [Magnetococcales bacterium]|nr:acyl-CoA dehydrogenase [Magnetococcales bacterium]
MTTYIIFAIVAFLGLAYIGKGFLAWVSAAIIIAAGWINSGVEHQAAFNAYVVIVAAIACLFAVPSLRRPLISSAALKLMKSALPTLGETEEIALKAGSVSFDGDIFSGSPNWKKFLNNNIKKISKDEQAFLDGPVEELCAMLDDEEISKNRDLPKKAWDFIKKNKFFGMLIAKEHGGLGFSAAAQSAVIMKISSRSPAAAVIVMVPNSLGPGELLSHYGTDEQKKHYLPRLAEGKEIPCFALTEPTAGSDAANGLSTGVITKGKFKGKEVLGINLNFNKRYITLAPVASVVGLAFKLYDPDGLVGDKKDLGITCALLPRDTEGLEIGNRHDPMGIPFPNGTVRGSDVFVPMEYVIGAESGLGKGWRMLMECLAAGRGISLPSLSVAATKLSARATTAYTHVREQFGLPIWRFEGVQEPLVRIATSAYMIDAARQVTCGAIDEGENPSVLSAVAKAYITETMRKSVNDAMDIFGGAAICRGDRNIFARPYYSIPIGITVEGANILTRSMIIFGQGAIRCHPFVQNEIEAIAAGDVAKFDKNLFGHINHFVRNKVRTIFYGLTCGAFIPAPVVGPEQKYYKSLTHFSAVFAFMTDVALLTLGGSLKFRESLSGRFADALAYQFLASATLKRYNDRGRNKEELPMLDWVMTNCLHNTETALRDLCDNMPSKLVGKTLKFLCFPYGACYKKPSDKQSNRVVKLLNSNPEIREMVSDGVFVPKAKVPGLGALESAYEKTLAAADARHKLVEARRTGKLDKGSVLEMAKLAKKEGIISDDELKLIKAAEKAKLDVIQVNEYTPEEYKELR